MKKALVLSGGGVRGAFESGFCDYIAKKGFVPDLIIGTSVGAINGAFLADSGKFEENAARLKNYWLHVQRKHVMTFNKSAIYKLAWAESLLSHKGLHRFLHQHLKARKFSHLSIPLHINTTRCHDGKPRIFKHGDLIPAILASASTPPIFPPIQIGKAHYIDGGINSTSMIREAKKHGAQKIIFINLHDHAKMHRHNTIFTSLSYLFHLMEKNIIHREKIHRERGVVEIRPKIALSNNYLDFSGTHTLVHQGERAARRAWKEKLF